MRRYTIILEMDPDQTFVVEVAAYQFLDRQHMLDHVDQLLDGSNVAEFVRDWWKFCCDQNCIPPRYGNVKRLYAADGGNANQASL